MKRILISACLLGEPVRYDGASKPLDHPIVDAWKNQGRLVPFCPETAGGLPIPRSPAEIQGQIGTEGPDGKVRVVTREGDVTAPFIAGAQKTLDLAREENLTLALLKERSPSCGSALIYDGSFSRNLVPGMGVTTALLRQHGILVFSENEIDSLIKCIK